MTAGSRPAALAMAALLLVPLSCGRDGGPASAGSVTTGGAPGARTISPYHRDAHPPTKAWPGPCIWFGDFDSDGEDEGTSIAAYDAQDRLVLVRTDWSKSGPDWQEGEPIPGPGQPKDHYRFTFDDKGRRATEEWVSHGDDHPGELVTFQYDESGRLKGATVDTGPDGKINGAVTYDLDDAGRVKAEHWDVDGDGEIDQEVTHTYDSFGNKLKSWFGPTGPYDEEFYDYHYACWEQGGPQRIDNLPPPMPDFSPGKPPGP